MSHNRRSGMYLLGALWLLTLWTGCTSPDSFYRDSPTGGLSLELFTRDESGAEALYRVERDGIFGFGGGTNARIGKCTWTTTLSPDEILELRSLIDAHQWLTRKPIATDRMSDRTYRIKVSAPGVRRRYRVSGVSAEIEPIREFLHRISLRRLEPDLERLPRPGGQE